MIPYNCNGKSEKKRELKLNFFKYWHFSSSPVSTRQQNIAIGANKVTMFWWKQWLGTVSEEKKELTY